MLGAHVMGVDRCCVLQAPTRNAGIPVQTSIFNLRHPVISQAPFHFSAFTHELSTFQEIECKSQIPLRHFGC
jgi:hypothetical protein